MHFQPECGLARTFQNSLQKRIIGGRPAHFAEYPWQAHIRIAEYQCGGVLVSKNMVATAAHCVQQARLQDIYVYLGELDTQNLGHAQEPLPAEKHNVIQKLIHPLFEFRMTQPDRYDLALLKLAKPTGFSWVSTPPSGFWRSLNNCISFQWTYTTNLPASVSHTSSGSQGGRCWLGENGSHLGSSGYQYVAGGHCTHHKYKLFGMCHSGQILIVTFQF